MRYLSSTSCFPGRLTVPTGVVSPFCSVTLSSWTPAPGCVFIPLGSPVTRRLHSNHEDWIETRYRYAYLYADTRVRSLKLTVYCYKH